MLYFYGKKIICTNHLKGTTVLSSFHGLLWLPETTKYQLKWAISIPGKKITYDSALILNRSDELGYFGKWKWVAPIHVRGDLSLRHKM